MIAVVLIGYAVFMLGLGLYQTGGVKEYKEYVIAGGRQSASLVTLSMLAGIIGGSATLGITDMALNIGFPAFWWLGVGALGLVLQALLLSVRVRDLGAVTLPDVAAMTAGPEARTLIALIIATAWMGVIAAQFTALAQVCMAMTGLEHARLMLVILSGVLIAYTAIGGQLSVLRTDAAQFMLIIVGVGAACLFLFLRDEADAGLWLSRMELFNSQFGWQEWIRLALLVGASYFIGPDIFSRALSAKDGVAARRAALWSAGGLVVFGCMITWIGVWAKAHGVGGAGANPLTVLIQKELPVAVSLLLGLGLVSALVSSAATCLMSAATILEHDLLQRRSLGRTRFFVVLAGSVALGIAFFKSDIIGLLLVAYSVYSPGIVPPLFLAILFHKRRKPHKPTWLAGVAVGGGCGLLAGVTGIHALPLIGMALSTLLAVISLLISKGAPQSAS